MINHTLEIPPLSRDVALWELEDNGRRRPLHPLQGVRVFSDHQNGIRLLWEIQDKKPRGVRLKPHEARALGALLIAAADDVLPFRKAGT